MNRENPSAGQLERPETTLRRGGRDCKIQGSAEGDAIFGEILKTGAFYEAETLEFIKTRRLAGTYVDIGANIGNHSLFFLAETDCDSLVAIEGNPALIPVLQHNLETNIGGAKPFQIKNEFVSSEEKLFFNPDPGVNTGASCLSRVPLAGDAAPVTARTLDAMLADRRKIAFLKVDVAGHEVEVLRSAESILKNFSPEICVEMAPASGEELVPWLMKFNYLPLASLGMGRVYFVKFGPLSFKAIRQTAKLPKPVFDKIGWRIVRALAVITGRLPAKMFRRHLPAHKLLRPEGT